MSDLSPSGVGSSRRKASFLQHQTSIDSLSIASTVGSMGSPWSPGISTPGLTPLPPPARRKRMTSSTPLFDIDNIVIPYSIASSTRLEKLEYKEILTPSWRQVEADVEGDRASPKPTEQADVEEDLSDQDFAKRHNRSELTEKKRFVNFVSGSNHRKRTRPQSVTLSESPGPGNMCHLTSPPPPRRLTIASPTPTELELLHLPDVMPWQPRAFPLNAEEEDALDNPPPPPPILPSSPLRHLHTCTPSSHSPSCNTSAYTTPLASPLSTPSEDTPASSPAEWVVNSQLNTASSTALPVLGHHYQQLPRVLTSSPDLHHPIILKLTKKT